MAGTLETRGQGLRDSASFELEHEGAVPLIRREGIDWSGGARGEPLRIRLCFENPGFEATAPTVAHVGVAAFGAFLPWRPLTTVSVPGIPPGGRVVLTATAHDDLPDPGARQAGTLRRAIDSLRRSLLRTPALRDRVSMSDPAVRQPASLKPEHFVGNLNVFVTGGKPVERHRNRSIGLRPGHRNHVGFLIGDGSVDHYTQRVEAEPDWIIELSDGEFPASIASGRKCVWATITAPDGTTRGRVTIWVRRASTGEEVPVEFELATDARTLACGEYSA